jgi:hypothetical protein
LAGIAKIIQRKHSLIKKAPGSFSKVEFVN